MNKETIEALGVWSVRLALVIGAIYCAVNGQQEVAGALAGIAVISFFLL